MIISDAILHRLGGLLARDNAAIGLIIHTRYEILGRIARGAMGEIFCARDLRLNRPVAMKLLASELSTSEWAARFEAEARTMTQIDHPGIVPIHDLGRLPDGRLYYTMKLIEGHTLDEMIVAAEPLRRLVEALAQACDIVQHAHDRGVIHRDLKPANIMLGDKGEVYLLDWGIARVRDEYRHAFGEGNTASGGLTSTGTILGTLEYMSPEQARGDLEAIDARSDVYSFGAVLYQMLTGKPPVTGAGVTELIEGATSGTIAPPRRHTASLPADLESACMKALDKEPDRRYQSVRDMADDLRRWLKGEAVNAHPFTLQYRVSKGIGRHRALSAMAGLMLLALSFFGAYWFLHRDDRTIADAKRRDDAVFGPILKRLDLLPQNLDGWKRGIALLQEGLDRHGQSWEAWLKKGELHERCSDHVEAAAAYQQAYRLNPRLGVAHYRRGRLLLTHLMPGRDDPVRRNAALMEFEAALRIDPDNEYALVGQAHLAWIKGNFSEALELCDRAAPLGAHVADLHYIRGDIYGDQHSKKFLNLDKSITELTKLIDLNPNNACAHHKRGSARTAKGDFDGAIADCSQSIALKPGDACGFTNRGYARRHKEDWEGALADYTKALEIKPGDAWTLNEVGVCRYMKGDLEGALQEYAKAIESDPAYAWPYYNRAMLKNDRREYDGAVADYTKSLELKPDHAWTYKMRGDALSDKEANEAAIADYKKAVELDPTIPSAYGNCAYVRLRLGDFDAAIEDCTKAIALAPDDPDHYQTRALARRNKGDRLEAVADFEKALEIAPPTWPRRKNTEALLWALNAKLKR